MDGLYPLKKTFVSSQIKSIYKNNPPAYRISETVCLCACHSPQRITVQTGSCWRQQGHGIVVTLADRHFDWAERLTDEKKKRFLNRYFRSQCSPYWQLLSGGRRCSLRRALIRSMLLPPVEADDMNWLCAECTENLNGLNLEIENHMTLSDLFVISRQSRRQLMLSCFSERL